MNVDSVWSAAQSEPAVDVLVTAFNAAATIEASIRSICNQTHRNLRIVVVDDGSTDGTPDVLKRLAASDPRLFVVTTPNRGIVDAANTGLTHCTAAYLARHDADDLAFPGRIEVQVAHLCAHADCVAVSSNAFHIDKDGRRTGHVTRFGPLAVGDPFHVPSVEPYLMHPFLLVRRQAVRDVGGYRHALYCEDTDLYWRLRHVGSLVTLDEIVGEYRVHADSISSRSVLNGRIAAVNSQRAAISEQRRLRARDDLDFDRSKLADYERAGTLSGIVDSASTGMTPDERRFLEIASVVKLLQLSSYRPYRLTPDDLRTARAWITRHYASMTRENRVYTVFKVILGRSRWRRDPREVLRLIPWSVLPAAIGDLVAHVVARPAAR